MCYSADVEDDYDDFVRDCGAVLSLREFAGLFWERQRDGSWTRIPRSMRDAFRKPRGEEGFELATLVAEGDRVHEETLRADLDAQKARLARAAEVLASSRPTKKAAEDERIARKRIRSIERNLEDLLRREPAPKDSRIFPGHYAPVLIERDGKRIVVPMRYQCRLPGWSAAVERKYPGTYNARRDRLETSWNALFGHRHGIMVIKRFYENVSRHRVEGRGLRPGEREENVVLEFDPRPAQAMYVACLWNVSKGADNGADLYSFAAITDEPPPEVAAAGHDRCVVPIKREHFDAWLRPDPQNLAALYAILDDRERPYYEHRQAA